MVNVIADLRFHDLQVKKMNVENQNLSRDIRDQVRSEYNDLVQDLFGAAFDIKQKYDFFRLTSGYTLYNVQCTYLPLYPFYIHIPFLPSYYLSLYLSFVFSISLSLYISLFLSIVSQCRNLATVFY